MSSFQNIFTDKNGQSDYGQTDTGAYYGACEVITRFTLKSHDPFGTKAYRIISLFENSFIVQYIF